GWALVPTGVLSGPRRRPVHGPRPRGGSDGSIRVLQRLPLDRGNDGARAVRRGPRELREGHRRGRGAAGAGPAAPGGAEAGELHERLIGQGLCQIASIGVTAFASPRYSVSANPSSSVRSR